MNSIYLPSLDNRELLLRIGLVANSDLELELARRLEEAVGEIAYLEEQVYELKSMLEDDETPTSPVALAPGVPP